MNSTASGLEPGYAIRDDGGGKWTVFKMDIGTGGAVLARHAVSNGQCDCEGWQHNMKCRHLQMVFSLFPVVSRKVARKAVAEVIDSWQGRFDRIVFEDYLFDGPEEEGVRVVKLRARGAPLVLEGKPYKRLFAVRRGAFVELNIDV